MTLRRSLALALFGTFLTGAAFSATGPGSDQLAQAEAIMNQGNFQGAIPQFQSLSTNPQVSPDVQREASYYIGFCDVRASDPWGAINAFSRFLQAYDRGDPTFIPDALFVLGRTYEAVNQMQNAISEYQQCIQRFPSSDFAAKCQDRMRLINPTPYNPPPPPMPGPGQYPPPGPGQYPPPCPPPGYTSYVTPNIQGMIDLAKSCPDSYSCDQMLLTAAGRAVTGQDYVAISKACRDSFTRSQILGVCSNSAGFRNLYIPDIVQIAQTSSDNYTRDQLLLAAAQNCCHMPQDYQMLMAACADSFTKSQILGIAQQALGMQPHFDVMASMEAAPNSAQAPQMRAAKPKNQNGGIVPPNVVNKIKKHASDPFEGFRLNGKRVQRVHWFIDAVRTKTKIDETSRQLSKDDMQLDIVKSAMHDTEAMKKFNNIHDGK